MCIEIIYWSKCTVRTVSYTHLDVYKRQVCGYWQVELDLDSRKYMAFIFDGKNYQFKRLPFGLINSIAIFVKCMDQILGQEALQFTTEYVDDLLITSSDWDEHCDRIEHVLRKLAENNITLKLDKSRLIADEVQFLVLFCPSQTSLRHPTK